jgi:hypothetical protein
MANQQEATKKLLAELANREVLGGQHAQLLLFRLSLFSLW